MHSRTFSLKVCRSLIRIPFFREEKHSMLLPFNKAWLDKALKFEAGTLLTIEYYTKYIMQLVHTDSYWFKHVAVQQFFYDIYIYMHTCIFFDIVKSDRVLLSLCAGSFDISGEVSNGLTNCRQRQGFTLLSTPVPLRMFGLFGHLYVSVTFRRCFIPKRHLPVGQRPHVDISWCLSTCWCQENTWIEFNWVILQANLRSWCRAYPMYSTSVQRCIVDGNPHGYAQELFGLKFHSGLH